jgi:hypothetical protein
MVATPAELRRQVYKHLIVEILGFDMDHPIPKALAVERAESIPDIISLREKDLVDLRYESVDTDGAEHLLPLGKGEQRLLAIIPSFVLFKRSKGDELKEADWLKITANEFQDYRASPDFINMRTRTTATVPFLSTTGAGHPQARTRDLVYKFKWGIKRGPSQFPTLKDDKQWDVWNQDARAQARSQDVMEIFTSGYKPVSPDDVALFDEKQKLMYAVFMKTVQTDVGKSFVRAHESKYDAQKIYEELVRHASASTKASIV